MNYPLYDIYVLYCNNKRTNSVWMVVFVIFIIFSGFCVFWLVCFFCFVDFFCDQHVVFAQFHVGALFFHLFSFSSSCPLSYFSFAAPNAPVACANVNSNANHAPDLISLDDLVFEKSGVQNYCSTSKADSSRKTLESKGIVHILSKY